MRCCDVNDVYVGIVDEFVVRSVGFGVAGDGELGDEVLCAARGGAAGDCGDGVGYVRGVARGGVFEEVFYEGCIYILVSGHGCLSCWGGLRLTFGDASGSYSRVSKKLKRGD